MAFMFASQIMPAQATTVTSGSWWAAMNLPMAGSIVWYFVRAGDASPDQLKYRTRA